MKNDRKTAHELIADLESAYQRVYEMETLLKEHGHREGNIAERPQTMSDMRESEIRYRRLFEAAKDGILILDAESGAITDANPFIREILGYSPEDLIGKRLWEIGAFFDVAASKAAFEELQYKEYIRYENLPLQTKDGQMREVEFISNVYQVDLKKVIQCNIRNITKRREAEKALEESEIRYRRLFESAKDGILILNAETGKIIAANPFLLEILNYSKENVIGKELWEIGPFKYIIANQNTFRKLQNQEYVRYENILLQNKEGVNVHMEFVSSYYSVKGRKVIQCNIRDITDRCREEEKLRETNEYLENLFNYANAPIIVWYPSLVIHRFNHAFERLSGYHTAEIRGKSIDVLFTKEKIESSLDLIRRATSGGNWETVEIEIQRKDGDSRVLLWNSANILHKDGTTVIATIAQGQDITERKRTEEAMRESEEQLHATFEQAAVGIAQVAPDGHFLRFNQKLCDIVGYTREELLTKTFQEITHPDDLETDLANLHQLIANDIQTYSREKRYIRKDKSSVWVNLTVSLLREPAGTPRYFVSVIEDITERKQAEEDLKVSEVRYRRLFESAQDGILILNADTGQITDINPFLEEMLGYSKSEVMGKTLWEIGLFKDILANKTNFAELQNKEYMRYEDLPLEAKDGTHKQVEFVSNVYLVEGKKVIQCNIRDITERKRTEEELRESEIRYRSVLQSATDAIVTADSGGIIVGWNSAAERIFGYSYTEAAGQSLTSLMPFYYQIGHSDGIKRVESRGDRHVIGKTVELEGLRKNKSVFPLELSLSTWETKEGYFFTGIIRDITERKRAVEVLRENEEKLRTLFEQLPIGVSLLDKNRKIMYINPALEKILDISKDDLLNEKHQTRRYIRIDGTTMPTEEFASERAFKEQRLVRDIETGVITESGKTIWTSVSAVPFSMIDEGLLIVTADITERKQMEEGLRKMQKLEGLGTLAGGIAHDFNNILGIILAYITSSKRFKDDATKLDLAVNTIVKAVERGKTLVQQILTFARKTETAFGTVDVNDVIMETMAMIFVTFPKTLTYSQNFDKSIKYIDADRSQLYQALLNLCVNARDAMAKGGVLTINTRLVSAASLLDQHPNAIESSYVCIEVSDTGEGMTSETQKRIFEPFFTTKEIGKGTGLGLAVVFGIVQTHKGFIDVESELGKGATFRLYLPATQVAEHVREKDEGALKEIPGGTETLLIVEDEEMLMMSLQMVLVEKGYTVITALDGLAAVKIYQENKSKIALVMTDLGLPTITGLEVCQRIKKINPNEHIVLATGFLDPEMKVEFLKEGIQHFLYKPYNLRQVLKVVREVIDEK